ncbi:glycine cleavage system protein GcvH [Saccharibacter sp. 17.LH.SD]|uniref:glycine cleavage system protein GcvH n=1 Tax=Saccharibacter sp. 17.LH.SD TaxID=2689393 RepID=UPI00136C41A7|nr:glycine cleavage system protein GcvH [Saccharibacter sp. 17.LH.SD]MXV45120.1 glycine cleavage system protein GcvH [Saccharibacter sp. 17.LH.SD]
MTTRYTETHEWVNLEGDTATIGITHHAAEELGDVVFVEAKEAGTELAAGEAVAVVESVKAASDIYTPLQATVLSFNEKLSDDPSLINSAPEGEGWIVKVKLASPEEFDRLLSAEQYQQKL